MPMVACSSVQDTCRLDQQHRLNTFEIMKKQTIGNYNIGHLIWMTSKKKKNEARIKKKKKIIHQQEQSIITIF